MDWSDIGSALSKVAPVLGGLVAGGPVGAGAAAISMLCKDLGVEADPKKIGAKLERDPGALKKMAEVEMKYIAAQTEMAQIAAGDRQDARDTFKHSKMPSLITLFIFILLCGMAYALFCVAIPAANKQASDMLMGAVISWCGSVIHGYFGGETLSVRRIPKK